MPGLETINDIVGDQVWDQLERRLPAGLENAAKKMAEVSAYFKANPISFTGNSTTIKQDIVNIDRLKSSQIALQKITTDLAKADLLSAKAATEKAKAADISARAQERATREEEKSIATSQKKAAQNNVASTSLQAMSRDLEGLRRGYARLTEEERKNVEIGGVLLARIQELDSALKKTDATQGKFNREVGNYSGALTGLQFSIRNIAGELPNLGISIRTFGQAISNNITPFVDSIKEINKQNAILRAEGKPTISVLKQIGQSFFSIGTLISFAIIAGLKLIEYFEKQEKASEKAAKKAEESSKKYVESLKSIEEASQNASQQDIARVHILTELAKDESQNMRNRLRAVKELQETYPSIFKNLTQQAILEGQLGDAVNKTTEALLQRASAQAAEKKFAAAGERVYELTIALRQQLKEIEKADKDLVKRDGVTSRGIFRTSETEGAVNKTREQYKKLNEELAKAKEEQKVFLKDALDASKLAGDTNFGKEPTPKVKDTATKVLRQEMREEDQLRAAQIAAQKELSDAIRDNRAALAEENIQTNKKIYEDERQTIDKRMEAYGEYYTSRQNQAKLNADKELSDIIELERQIAKIKAEDPSHRSDSDKALLLREEGLAERRKGILSKYNADLAILATDAAKDQLKILESYSDEAINFLNSRIATLKELGSDIEVFELEALLSRLEKGKISLRNYEKEKKIIQDKAAIDSIKTEMSVIEEQLKAETLSINVRMDLEKRLHDLKVKLNDQELKLKEDSLKKSISLNKEQISVTISSAQDLVSAIQSAMQFKYDLESQSADAQSEAIDKNLKKELDAIAISGKSKQEQEDAETAARGRAAAAQNQIDQDRRKAQVEQARLNKATAIANIILTTSQAVIQAFAEGDPYTKAVRAAAAGVAGAAQLAIAFATPIPSYAEGTDFHPGGKARYGEAGAEWIEKPGQTPYLATKETIEDLPRGTKVTPVDKMMQRVNNETVRRLAGQNVTPEMYAATYISSFERLTGEMGKVNNKIGTLTDVVKNKKEFKVDITPDGLRWGAKDHNARTEYLNRRIHV